MSYIIATRPSPAEREQIRAAARKRGVVLLAATNPGLKVLTVDRKDFSIYRTPVGKPIACEFPPR